LSGDRSNHTHDPAAFARELSRISAPALVIWGENDRLFPAAHGKRLADELKARLVLVPDGRHMPFAYKPAEVADAVLHFLTEFGQ
jgi:pimeloyl-ACP methyl ester carboxylesterase